MGSSYREEINKYKLNKNIPIEDSGMPHIKKKTKKHKKSSHKHEYIPAVYHNVYIKSIIYEKKIYDCYGFHCKYCGRVLDLYFTWDSLGNKIEDFKAEHPDYIDVTLPDNWDFFKDKSIPMESLCK